MTEEIAIVPSRAAIDFSRPINLQLRVRNNILLQAIRQRAPSVAAFCRVTGYPQQVAQAYIGFKRSPVWKRRNGVTHWNTTAVRLATLLDLSPEEAFPPEIADTVKRNTIEVFCAAAEDAQPQISPRDEIAWKEIGEKLRAVLWTLTDRDRYVLEWRFGLRGRTKTLKELARELNLTRSRILQIEARALSKLRHHRRSRVLKPLLEEITDLEAVQ